MGPGARVQNGARCGQISTCKWERCPLRVGPHSHAPTPILALGGLQTGEPECAGLSPELRSATDVSGTVPLGPRVSPLHLHPYHLTVPLPRSNSSAAPASGSLRRHWRVFSKFQYLPQGPVIDFLNTKLLDAVVEAFLPQASWWRKNRSGRPRTDVNFHSISREDVHSVLARESLSWP